MARKPKLKSATLPPEQKLLLDATIAAWRKAAEETAAAAERENALRIKLVTTFFPDAKEGTTTMELGDGVELKAEVRINRSVDRAQLDGLLDFLKNFKDDGSNPDLAERVPVLQGIVDTTISYKPEVVIGAFKELSEEHKKYISDVITEKVGTPGLKYHIAPPKV